MPLKKKKTKTKHYLHSTQLSASPLSFIIHNNRGCSMLGFHIGEMVSLKNETKGPE